MSSEEEDEPIGPPGAQDNDDDDGEGPMGPPGAGVQFDDEQQQHDGPAPPPGAGRNFRVPLRGQAGRHRHTQSSAAVLHRSAFSTGSLGSSIGEYSRMGRFMPMPPPSSIDEAGESPSASPRRGSASASQSSPDLRSKGEELLGGFGGGGDALPPPRGGRPGLSLNLEEDAAPETVDNEEEAVRGRLVNRFAQEVLRSYPSDLAAFVGKADAGRSPSHRRPRVNFVLEDLDASTWTSADPDAEAEVCAARAVRACARRACACMRACVRA